MTFIRGSGDDQTINNLATMTVFDFAMAAVHDLVLLMFAALTVLGCYLRDNFKQRLKYPLSKYPVHKILHAENQIVYNECFGKISNKIWVFNSLLIDH